MRFGTGGDARPRGAGWERLNILVGEAIVGALRSGGEDAMSRCGGELGSGASQSAEVLGRFGAFGGLSRHAERLFENVEKTSRSANSRNHRPP